MRFRSILAFGVLILLFDAEPSSSGRCAAQDATEPPAAGADAAAKANPDDVLLPKIGPELLTMTPEGIEKAFEGGEMPEAIKMYLVIARGGQLDGRGGWFGPAQSRFSWLWLAQQCGVDPDDEMAGIKPDQFKADDSLFQALDRDKDGQLTRWDLDWSSSNSWVQQSSMIRSIFRRMDASSDFRLSRDEWNAVFEQAAQGSDEARFEQIREAWISSSPPGFSPGDEPSKETLVQGLFNSELGSLQEGPHVDEPAPLFELRTLAGDQIVRLEDLIGTKPIVLTFGNFTCGPFRSLYTLVESVRERRAEDAHFLLVYVREAHPTDGWAMSSNEKLGVAVAQPKTFADRTLVAQQCAAKLNPKMPLLVDTIDDEVGNAYSGMPARLYVIDREGKVAYKSGRGPFGFKPEEMEQSLLMLKVQEQLQDKLGN